PARHRDTRQPPGEFAGRWSPRRRLALAPGRPICQAQPPVAANQLAPAPGEVTNTMGAMHGWGSVTVALMFELPVVLAGNSAVLTLVMVAVPPAPMLWQLTMAWKSGNGVTACRAGGTGAWSASPRPRTRTRR